MANALQKVAADLGGTDVLGREVTNEMVMVDLITEGLPVETTRRVVTYGIVSDDEIRDLVVPQTTLARRMKSGRLDAAESDKLVRITRVVELAREALGEEKGDRWMRRPNRALQGKVPLELCRSEAGARMVEDVIGRLNYGGVS